MTSNLAVQRLKNNVLDKEFQIMLFPLNLIQTVLLQPKYRIIRSTLNTNGSFSHMLCILGFSFVTVANVGPLLKFNLHLNPSLTLFFDLAFIEAIFNIFSCLIMVILNISQKKKNVLLITNIQEARLFVNCNNYVKNHRNVSWAYIIAILFSYVLVFLGHYTINMISLTNTLFTLSLMYFDGNIVITVQMVKLLIQLLRLWREELDRFVATCSETDHNQLIKYLNDVSQRKERLLRAYWNIQEAYKLCGDIFYVEVLLLAARIFLFPLIFMETFIWLGQSLHNFHQYSYSRLIGFLVAMVWSTKNFVLLICVCAACQQFEQTVTEVDAACAVTSCKDCLVDVRRLCKNVSRVSACARAGGGLRTRGALAVDAALPVRLLALLATYTVVLLQFALL